MKKFLVFLTILFLPTIVSAAEISSTSITGPEEGIVGKEISLSFNLQFADLPKGDDKTLGIWIIGFKLDYDTEVLVPTNISSNGFDSAIAQENGYYAVSIAKENSTNSCAMGQLYCGNYSATIKFYIKDTVLPSTEVKMSEIEVDLLDMTDESKSYTLDDAIQLTSSNIEIMSIKLNKTNNVITETPKSVTTVAPKIQETRTTPKVAQQTVNTVKSNNTYLKSLSISNYNINFSKEITDYTLNIKKDINSLDVNVATEDSKATYKIIGANDLKANNNKILIEVTAEDGSKKNYSITTNISEEADEMETTKKIVYKSKEEKKKKINIMPYIFITLGITILIIVIVLIINKFQNKKIDKKLNEL